MIKQIRIFNNFRKLTRHRINLNSCIIEELKFIDGKKIINFGGLKVELKNKFWNNIFFHNKKIVSMNINGNCDIIINEATFKKYKEFCDVLFCIEVIQCVDDLEKILSQIKTLTKINGKIILSFPSSTPYHGFAGEKTRPTPHHFLEKVTKFNFKLLKIYKFGSVFDIFIDGLRRNEHFFYKVLFIFTLLIPVSKKVENILSSDLDKVYSGFVFILKRE